MEGVDDVGVCWESITFWSSSFSSVDVSKKSHYSPFSIIMYMLFQVQEKCRDAI